MKIVAVLSLATLLAAGCSTAQSDSSGVATNIKQSQQAEPPETASQSRPPEALALIDAVDIGVIFQSIDELRVDRPVTVYWTEFSTPAPPPPGAPEGPFRTTEVITTDPAITTAFVTVDYTEIAILWDYEIDRRTSEGDSETESEVMRKGLMTWAASSTMRLSYYTSQQPEAIFNWVRFSDVVNYSELRMQLIHRLWAQNSKELAPIEHIDLPQFSDRWIVFDAAHSQVFPSGHGPMTSSQAAATVLQPVRAWDQPDLATFQLRELTRTDTEVCVELLNSARNRSAEICLDASLAIVSLQAGNPANRKAATFDWDPDLSVLQLPEASLQMNVDDLAEAEEAYEWFAQGMQTIEGPTRVISVP